MITAGQIILINLVIIINFFLGSWMIALPYGTEVILGALVGAIMGDVPTGLAVGGTMGLMSIGMNPLGGAVVPDYTTGTIVGTALAIASGQGLEVAISVGIPAGLLGVELTLLLRSVNEIFLHQSMKANKNHDYDGALKWIWVSLIPGVLFACLPTTLMLIGGEVLVNAVINYIPDWLYKGLTVASGVLPALGFAILLHSLPLRNNFMFVILGYALTSFLGLNVTGVCFIAFVLAWLCYTFNEKYAEKGSVTVAQANGGIEDDE